jgi:hypothetical protein
MTTLSTPSQERFFRLLLLPFKAYVIIASIWLIYAVSAARSAHVGLGELSGYVLVAYAICVPFFVLAALVQFLAHWRRPALISISFASVAAIILAILWQPFLSSFVK